MASSFGNMRDSTAGFVERFLLRHSPRGAARNLTVGCFMILLSSFGLVILGLFLQPNVFVVMTGHLVGVAILSEAAARLVFDRQRTLAVRLRLLAAVASALASISLVAMVLHFLGALPLGA